MISFLPSIFNCNDATVPKTHYHVIVDEIAQLSDGILQLSWSHHLKELQCLFVSRTSLNLRIGLQNYVYFASFCPSSIDHKYVSSSLQCLQSGQE